MTHLVFVALFLFQGQGAAPAAPGLGPGTSAAVDVFRNIGPVAWAVLIILAIGSVYSWAIILSKWSLFRKAQAQNRRFLRAFRKATRLQEISAVSDQFKPSPLAPVFDEIYDVYRGQTGGYGPPRNPLALERAAQSACGQAATVLEERMTWLATIGATAPFVGLFGTVMGIISAFQGLGNEGTATLRAVAPGVSEALVTTAAGLVVAVPAVIAFNQFTSRLRDFASRLDDFAREMLGSLDEIPSQAGPDPLEREAARGLHH